MVSEDDSKTSLCTLKGALIMSYKFEVFNPNTCETIATKDIRTAYRFAHRSNREARYEAVTHITNIETGRVYMINSCSVNRNIAHGHKLMDNFNDICSKLMEYEDSHDKRGIADFALTMWTAGFSLM